MDTKDSVLTILWQIFWQNTKIFRSKNEKEENIHLFQKKTWLERSWGIVEYCVLQWKKKWSLSKNNREKFFFKQFSSKYIYRYVKCRFFNPVEKSLPESRLFFLIKVRKKIENSNIFYFLRKFFSSTCSVGFVEYFFDNPIERNLTERQNFFAHVRKR